MSTPTWIVKELLELAAFANEAGLEESERLLIAASRQVAMEVGLSILDNVVDIRTRLPHVDHPHQLEEKAWSQ